MVEQIKAIHDDVSRALQLSVMTPEYEIVLFLLESTGTTARELMSQCSLSAAGFHKTLGRLRHWGVVTSELRLPDKRHRYYRLSPKIAASVYLHFRRYQVSQVGFQSHGLDVGELEGRHAGRAPDDRLEHLTCEYQILLYLYLQPKSTYTKLSRLVVASPTKFTSALLDLDQRGLIISCVDPADRRRRLYTLAERSRTLLDDAHQRSFAWLERGSKLSQASS